MAKIKQEPKAKFFDQVIRGVKKLIRENVKVEIKEQGLVITIRPPKNIQLNLFEEVK